MFSTGGDARDGAIGDDENGSDGVGVLPDLSCDTLPKRVDLRFLKIANLGETRRIENADLGTRLRLSTTLTT